MTGATDSTVTEQIQVTCCVCETSNTVSVTTTIDADEIYVCRECPPTHPRILYDRTADADEGELVVVRELVDETADSMYPGEAQMLSLAEFYSDVPGVSGEDAVVMVSEQVANRDDVVFSAECVPRPVSVLHDVVVPDV